MHPVLKEVLTAVVVAAAGVVLSVLSKDKLGKFPPNWPPRPPNSSG